ncbi:hypothetical protein N0V85_000822 [Neurospora sp. IMI 360204]|nr:hypothetical protein N0V85_000822 [Neurospora sp. IMI 360204]
MPKRTLASARGAHSNKAQGINPNKRLAGRNIRTVPQRMTAQAEPSGPGEEPEEEPEEEPAAKKRKTTKAAGGKRKRASNDEEEREAERSKKKAKPAANKKAAKGKGKSPKKKKKASNKAQEPEEPEEPYNPNKLWAVRDILAEKRDEDGNLLYNIDWEPTNGRKWKPTWEPAENVVSPEIIAEWEERRAQRVRSEEEVMAEAVDPDDIEVEEVPEEELPDEEVRREIVHGRRRAGPKPKTKSKYPGKKLVAMIAPK